MVEVLLFDGGLVLDVVVDGFDVGVLLLAAGGRALEEGMARAGSVLGRGYCVGGNGGGSRPVRTSSTWASVMRLLLLRRWKYGGPEGSCACGMAG